MIVGFRWHDAVSDRSNDFGDGIDGPRNGIARRRRVQGRTFSSELISKPAARYLTFCHADCGRWRLHFGVETADDQSDYGIALGTQHPENLAEDADAIWIVVDIDCLNGVSMALVEEFPNCRELGIFRGIRREDRQVAFTLAQNPKRVLCVPIGHRRVVQMAQPEHLRSQRCEMVLSIDSALTRVR